MFSLPNFFSWWTGLFKLSRYNNGGRSMIASCEFLACMGGVSADESSVRQRGHIPDREDSVCSSMVPDQWTPDREISKGRYASLTAPLDPRSDGVKMWNRAFLVARGLALVVDPLFFYVLTIASSDSLNCLSMNRRFLAAVTVIRTCLDVFHFFDILLQFRLAYVSRVSMVVGCGELVWDSRAIVLHYLRSMKGFWFDAFVILPIPQVLFWVVLPRLISEENIKLIMIILMMVFLFQFLPKVYHTLLMIRRMEKLRGYIFGTVWWGFCLNLIAYMIAAHVTGGCWYILAVQRVASCIQKQCERSSKCNLSMACLEKDCQLYSSATKSCGVGGKSSVAAIKSLCLDGDGPFPYGIYQWALSIVSSDSLSTKILSPMWWGLSNLNTFGNNLEPTSELLEVTFCIIIILSGVGLFILLIGNIQVFLYSTMARKTELQLQSRDMKWWMSRRQLPSRLRKRVRWFERRGWETLEGVDEMKFLNGLPEGLRRDIKRFLCLDLMKKVPLFHDMDDLILSNICDRVTPLIFSKDEKIIKEGDPVQRMVFIVQGRVKRNQTLSQGMTATSVLESGGFLGDELLGWCLRRPLLNRLPPSSATFVSLEPIEAYALDAKHLQYITDHFRYKLGTERLKRTARYYSSNWRTWGAVNIQLAWRRYRTSTRSPVNLVATNENKLMQYAAMFMALKPHDHLE